MSGLVAEGAGGHYGSLVNKHYGRQWGGLQTDVRELVPHFGRLIKIRTWARTRIAVWWRSAVALRRILLRPRRISTVVDAKCRCKLTIYLLVAAVGRLGWRSSVSVGLG